MTMKAPTTRLFLLASLAMAAPAMAASAKSAPVKAAASAPSPYIDYKDTNAVVKAIEGTGFKVTKTDSPLQFTLADEVSELNIVVGECPNIDTCGIGFAFGLIDLPKKPTDAWLARMNDQGAVAVVRYKPEMKQVEVGHTFTLKGINEEALHFSLTNTLTEVDLVFESVQKNEHLKK
jgi:hypothetical protein